MKLYDYYRSTACYRVRIALNLKRISYETIAVHLVNNGGEQHHTDYVRLNPQELVPTLDENNHIITQSLAIIEYLDELYPDIPLLPKMPLARAHVRALALTIACDMHPLNNLRVLNYLRTQLSANDTQIQDWYFNWLKLGFDSIEAHLQAGPQRNHLCYGHDVTLADICLIPQVYNAHRFGFSMTNYPLINAVNEHCLSLPAFKEAEPLNAN